MFLSVISTILKLAKFSLLRLKKFYNHIVIFRLFEELKNLIQFYDISKKFFFSFLIYYCFFLNLKFSYHNAKPFLLSNFQGKFSPGSIFLSGQYQNDLEILFLLILYFFYE